MTSTDPYEVLGVAPSADDAAIRARYLALTQQYSPERQPKEFAAVRAAYDAVKSLDDRVQHRLFPEPEPDAIQAILEELACQTPRPRIALETLIATVMPAR
jgi:curved DNA-binding protein CbpA